MSQKIQIGSATNRITVRKVASADITSFIIDYTAVYDGQETAYVVNDFDRKGKWTQINLTNDQHPHRNGQYRFLISQSAVGAAQWNFLNVNWNTLSSSWNTLTSLIRAAAFANGLVIIEGDELYESDYDGGTQSIPTSDYVSQSEMLNIEDYITAEDNRTIPTNDYVSQEETINTNDYVSSNETGLAKSYKDGN